MLPPQHCYWCLISLGPLSGDCVGIMIRFNRPTQTGMVGKCLLFLQARAGSVVLLSFLFMCYALCSVFCFFVYLCLCFLIQVLRTTTLVRSNHLENIHLSISSFCDCDCETCLKRLNVTMQLVAQALVMLDFLFPLTPLLFSPFPHGIFFMHTFTPIVVHIYYMT